MITLLKPFLGVINTHGIQTRILDNILCLDQNPIYNRVSESKPILS